MTDDGLSREELLELVRRQQDALAEREAAIERRRSSGGTRRSASGFRSAWGAEASAIRTTILTTARKQARNLLDAFRAVAGPSPLHALPARS